MFFQYEMRYLGSGEQEKESIMSVRVGLKSLSLAITESHHSASLVVSIWYPWDRFFYPTLTLMMDSYNLDPV